MHCAEIVQTLNINPAFIKFQWEAVPEVQKAQQDATMNAFMSTMQSFTGTVKSETRDVDIDLDKETEKWVDEFGNRDTQAIAEYVEAAFKDYHYLRLHQI